MPADRAAEMVSPAEILEGRSFFPIFTAWLQRDDRRAAAWSAFATEARWQLERACLVTLADMGMSDQSIGTYFSVSAHDVKRLRDRYDIAAASGQDAAAATAGAAMPMATELSERRAGAAR